MYIQSNALNIPLPNESVKLVIADPPFGIKFTGKPSNYNRIDYVAEYLEFDGEYQANQVISEIYRVLKPNGTLWLVMGWNSLSWWEMACGKYFPQMLGHVIWKYQFGVYAKKRPVVSHYHLLIYTKNAKYWTWNQQGYDEDVWVINRPYRRGEKKYPNRLPDKVVENMIIRSSNPKDIIYDPFVGSGTTVRVANSLGRIGIGSDLQNNKEFWS